MSAQQDHRLWEDTAKLISDGLQCGKRRLDVWSDRNDIYDTILNALSSVLKKQCTFETQKVQKISRAMLQLEQIFHSDWKNARCTLSDLDQRIWSISIQIIIDEDFPTESSLLISSTFSLFLNSLWEPEKVAQVVCSLLKKLGDKFEDVADFNFNTIATSRLAQPVFEATPCFPILLLIHGLLNCGQNDCLLTTGIDNLLILELFQYVLELCRAKSYYQFHAFQLLLSWLQFMNRNMQAIFNNECNRQCRQYLFSYDSHIVRSLTEVFEANWENPINGVTELLRKSYALMISIGKLSEQLFKNETHCNHDNLGQILTRQMLKLPNSCKGKYFALSALIPDFGVCNLLATCDSFSLDLASTLSANHLASAGSDVYRVILTVVRKEVGEQDLLNVWSLSWMEPLMSALRHKDRIIQQNSVRYWLPITLQHLPDSYELLYRSVKDLSTKIILMKAARRMGNVTYDELDISAIKCALFHSSDCMRSEAFAILCSTIKKAEPLSGEVALVKEFLPLNLNIYDTAFRHQLYTNLQNLLIRLRDSCVACLSSAKRRHSCTPPFLDDCIDFVEWLWELLLDNLQPGVCYQRRQTCLELLKAILNVFITKSDQRKHKVAITDRTIILTEYVKSRNKWNFISLKARSVLLICLMDYMTEIKEMACNTLEEYFMQLADDSVEDLDNVFDLGFKLCNSPKAFLSASGSLILKYFFCWANMHIGYSIIHNTPEDFVRSIYNKLNAQFELAKSDMLESAKTAPMHGLVLALQRILCESKVQPFWKIVHNASATNKLIADIINLAEDIVNFCLSVLAVKTFETDVSPSFADMGQAIEDIRSKKPSSDDTRAEAVLSLDHEFVLSCYWLNLKHCSHLVGNIVSCLPIQTDARQECDVFIDTSCVEKVGNILVSIMQRTRHRGAIEACGEALKLFCGRLFESTDHRLLQIPSAILNTALHDVVATANVTSVTRRSAGLAILAPAVVSSEIRTRQRKTFEMTVKKLLDVARLPVGQYSDQCNDLPQSQSLHILRAFVHDASLTQDVQPYLQDTMAICLEAFTSPVWVIRNAALQLYGAVIPKLFGQKKSSEEWPCKNTMTAKEFFGRYPQLEGFLLKHLTDVNVTSTIANHSTLIPILAVLGRLTPQSSSNGASLNRHQFASCLKTLLSSPIWYVRKIAAVAFSAVTDQDTVAVVCEDLAASLCRKDGASSYNQIHGYIMALRNLLTRATSNLDCANVRKLQESLQNSTWLLTDHNKCFVVKVAAWKLFLNLPPCLNLPLQQLVSDCITTENPNSYRLWMPGEKTYCGMKTWLILHSCLVDELPVHVRQFLLERDSGQDCKKACLKYLRTNIANNSYNWSDVQDILLDAAVEELLPSILLSILDLIMLLFFEKDIASNKLQSETFKDLFERIATDQRFTTVAALAHELWSVVAKVRIKNMWSVKDAKNVEVWAKFLCCRSAPHQSEIFRKSAAKSLRISGSVVLHTISDLDRKVQEQLPGHQEIVVSIFEAGMSLLQDENMEVRQEAACFASLLNNDGLQCSFHVNYAIQLLGEFVINNFGSCITLWNNLWDKLNDAPSSFACIRSQMDSTLVLFQQDDINVYAEPCLISKFYLQLLQKMVHKVRSTCEGTALLTTWIDAMYETVIKDALNVVACLENVDETKQFQMLSYGKTPSILANLRSRLQFLKTAKPSLKNRVDDVIRRLDHSRPLFIQST